MTSTVIVMNGWKEAPHQWKRFVFQPFGIDKTPYWTSVSAFGFTFFFIRG